MASLASIRQLITEWQEDAMIHGLKVLITLCALVAVAPAVGLAAAREVHGAGTAAARAAVVASETPVNINTADVKALTALTGVGRKLAEKIVEYRDAHGPFKKPEELRKVEGVGNGLWEKNRDRIVVK
jgi:competence protein ComEA